MRIAQFTPISMIIKNNTDILIEYIYYVYKITFNLSDSG